MSETPSDDDMYKNSLKSVRCALFYIVIIIYFHAVNMKSIHRQIVPPNSRKKYFFVQFISYKSFKRYRKLILVKTKKSKNMRRSYKGGKKDNVTFYRVEIYSYTYIYIFN